MNYTVTDKFLNISACHYRGKLCTISLEILHTNNNISLFLCRTDDIKNTMNENCIRNL